MTRGEGGPRLCPGSHRHRGQQGPRLRPSVPRGRVSGQPRRATAREELSPSPLAAHRAMRCSSEVEGRPGRGRQTSQRQPGGRLPKGSLGLRWRFPLPPSPQLLPVRGLPPPNPTPVPPSLPPPPPASLSAGHSGLNKHRPLTSWVTAKGGAGSWEVREGGGWEPHRVLQVQRREGLEGRRGYAAPGWAGRLLGPCLTPGPPPCRALISGSGIQHHHPAWLSRALPGPACCLVLYLLKRFWLRSGPGKSA